MKILLISNNDDHIKDFFCLICDSIGSPMPDIQSCTHNEVFLTALPDDATAAFLSVDCMSDAESARQFTRAYPQTPLIIVGGNSSAALMAVELGACYYLERNANVNEISEALIRVDTFIKARESGKNKRHITQGDG